MDVFTLKYFLGYFASWYPVITPVAIGLLLLAISLLDWARTGIMGYADDFETHIDLKFTPFLYSLLFPGQSEYETGTEGCRALDHRGGRPWSSRGSIKSTTGGWYVSTHSYWDSVKCPTARQARFMSQRIVGQTKEETSEMCTQLHKQPFGGVDSLTIGIFVLLAALFGILVAYKFAPSITIGLAVAYATLRLTRTVVRLTKKLKSHMTNPNAHKSTDEAAKVAGDAKDAGLDTGPK